LEIPASTEFVHGSAFAGTKLQQIDIEVGNGSLVTDGCFVESSDRRKIIRFFGWDVSVVVPACVEGLEESSFERRSSLMSIGFELGSRLRTVGVDRFSDARVCVELLFPVGLRSWGVRYLKTARCLNYAKLNVLRNPLSFGIPGSVEWVGADCFMACSELSRLVFDSGSSLERVLGDFGLDDFLSHVGIDATIVVFQVEVQDGDIGHDMAGWIREGGEGSAVRYVPEYQR
jgi:hypothetical protein